VVGRPISGRGKVYGDFKVGGDFVCFFGLELVIIFKEGVYLSGENIIITESGGIFSLLERKFYVFIAHICCS